MLLQPSLPTWAQAQGDEFNVKKMVDLFVAKAKEWQVGVTLGLPGLTGVG